MQTVVCFVKNVPHKTLLFASAPEVYTRFANVPNETLGAGKPMSAGAHPIRHPRHHKYYSYCPGRVANLVFGKLAAGNVKLAAGNMKLASGLLC